MGEQGCKVEWQVWYLKRRYLKRPIKRVVSEFIKRVVSESIKES